ESDEEEGEVTQDSDSKSMQEWKEDGESEELADFEHLEEPDSTQSTLESYQEVLEENISPNAEELDEDEEVDERAVSDDEGLTGMLDSPYPTVYVDETGFFAETEEQRWRRKLIELYNELPEEMKQLYRELVKAMLESEEGLEKLLDTFSELREYEDFEEEHEDAIKYVKFRQKIRELELLGTQEETTVKELALEVDIDKETAEKWLNDDYDSFPKIIQQVWKQEIERRWGNVLRAIANRDVPYDMSEINEILKRFPELKRKRRFGWHYDEVKAWTEVMAAKRRGRIATLIIQGKERFKIDEVKELAKRFNLTMGKVVRWLRDEDRPRLVDVLTEKNEFMKECIERGVTAQDVEKRNKNIQECNAKHPFRRTDSETDEEATTTQDDISPSRNESPVAQTHDTESKGTVSEVGEITEMFSWLKHENQLLLAAILSEKGQDLETWRGHKGLAYFRQLVHLQTEHILVLADQIASTSLEGTKHSPRNCRGKLRTLWTNAFDESAKGFLQEPFELESHNRDYIVEKIRAKGPSGVEEFSHTWKYDFLSRLSQLREELEPKITFSQITLRVRNIDRVLRYGFRKAESARLLFELLRARSNMAFEATLRGGTEASTLARRGNTYYLLSQLIGVWQASCVLSTSKELDLNGLSA
ncbi:hypothetical protein KAU87_05795, partial [Candidatus Bathyarchaeota archaeon]|nr:hypothetical protein [Candidatus Bathyarchaeota archaeon]